MTTLLPPSTSRTERNLATAGDQAMQLPLPFRSLWSPWTCPTHLLPYLAASWSVDRWDDKWPESTKRQVIANSYFVHSHKGTIGAIRRVVEPLGYLIRVLEWWQETPNAAPGTFKLDIGVLDTGITETMYQELERLIADAKPMTRHLTGLAISMETRGQLYLGAACHLGEELTVYPYQPGPIVVTGLDVFGAAVHTIDITSISTEAGEYHFNKWAAAVESACALGFSEVTNGVH
ncbi:phage tail protein I [Aeromonas hydrophila]|uniref:phage tail protein I n=1 Tax=Aeromonas hydrophila TaxID=644 RepID=UPI00227AB12F|nr:phage tail protein I [Aeromonas hydrophila]WAG17122.1 phage tail protein I [Aeromonas hydrophila]